jgi:hypothetical protein
MCIQPVMLGNRKQYVILDAYILKRYDAMAAHEKFMTFRAFL